MPESCYVLCPHCNKPFFWDGLGQYDECPHFLCRKEVDCIANSLTSQQYGVLIGALPKTDASPTEPTSKDGEE